MSHRDLMRELFQIVQVRFDHADCGIPRKGAPVTAAGACSFTVKAARIASTPMKLLSEGFCRCSPGIPGPGSGGKRKWLLDEAEQHGCNNPRGSETHH